ncbi:MAG: 16S rRNA (cytosine(967)-C(5))-methyltransferase RsmB [Clostridia bacterium]|nr:16S rRNA (cytosine(967)-C(5))-methyltransferase RsmB [Clostridia bacterium]
MDVNVRKCVLKLLGMYESEGSYVNLILNTDSLASLPERERALVTSLLYTTVEHKLTYDYLIAAFSSRPVSELSPYVRDLLRIGLCQILDIDSVPDFAAVSETVKLARHEGERKFVNAVLRRAVREKENLPLPPREKNAARYLSVRYSVPGKTVKLFISLFGEEDTEALLRSYSSPAPLSLTVNESKISREALMALLAESGISAERERYTDNGIRICRSISPERITGFAEGLFFVQDESSRISGEVLGTKNGDTVIDLCAAPGGKSFLAAIRAGQSGKVYSYDLHESKLSLITGGAARLGLTNIEAAALDSTELIDELIGKADRVICDVPCSGLGVFRKKPDLRYKDIEASLRLAPIQAKILRTGAKYLRAGGTLVYSTCTLSPDENENITDAFIEENRDFEYEGFTVGDISAPSGKLTLLPHIHATDGFYIAKIRKKNDN